MLFLWDIDGTLIRGRGAGRRAMNRAFQKSFGVENAFANVHMAGGLDLHFVAAAFHRYHIGDSFQARFLQNYYETLQEEIGAGSTELLPGVREVLDRLSGDSRFYHALGTGNMEPGARIKLDIFGLNPYFPVGGFCEAPTERYKVLQSGVDRARRYYGVDFRPEEVVVIGDTLRDVEAARQIGAKVLAVATGGNTYEELQSVRPDWLVENLRAMPIL